METEKKLTEKEEEFYRHLKKQLFLSGINIQSKVSLYDICNNYDMPLAFGNDVNILKQIDIDFVLYKKGKLIAGIEILDEPNELDENLGEKTLIDFNFKRLSAQCHMILGTDDMKMAAAIIKEKISLH